MRRSEIRKQFDAIVDFSGVERFLDTPVKRYSSGMYVRLAFAVAAHLRSEIVLVDEVLAVGDAEFQRKCIGKMKDIACSGRTVLFVSHNMSAIRAFCNSAVLLDAGAARRMGDVDAVISDYMSCIGSDQRSTWTRSSMSPNGPLTIESVSCQLVGAQPQHSLDVSIMTRSSASHLPAFVAIDVSDVAGQVLMQAIPTMEGFITADAGKPAQESKVRITLPPLIPGRYDVTVWAGPHNTERYDLAESCVSFEIVQSPTAGRTFPHTPDHGRIVPVSRLLSPQSADELTAAGREDGAVDE
jgi:lipopolysaccharide transport system ATP-binding protein